MGHPLPPCSPGFLGCWEGSCGGFPEFVEGVEPTRQWSSFLSSLRFCTAAAAYLMCKFSSCPHEDFCALIPPGLIKKVKSFALTYEAVQSQPNSLLQVLCKSHLTPRKVWKPICVPSPLSPWCLCLLGSPTGAEVALGLVLAQPRAGLLFFVPAAVPGATAELGSSGSPV